MRIITFSDIHSNIPALNNIIKEVEKETVDNVFCLGDLVGYGPRPNEVINKIRELKIPTIMGNYDEGVGYEKGECGCAYITAIEKSNGQISIDWTTKRVTPKNKEFLKTLHEKIQLDINGYNVLLVHGSPRRINEYLYEDRPEGSLKRILEDIDIDVLLCGHTHIPYHRVIDGVHIINDGSVGKPKDGDPRACYVVIDLSDEISIEFKRVKYPIKKVTKEIKRFGLPSVYAEALLNAK
jgi:putative phosphoesterase